MPVVRPACFDSSVLLKRYIREPGSDRAIALSQRHFIISAPIAPLEMRSAAKNRQTCCPAAVTIDLNAMEMHIAIQGMSERPPLSFKTETSKLPASPLAGPH